jgi:hypothetical protein
MVAGVAFQLRFDGPQLGRQPLAGFRGVLFTSGVGIALGCAGFCAALFQQSGFLR